MMSDDLVALSAALSAISPLAGVVAALALWNWREGRAEKKRARAMSNV